MARFNSPEWASRIDVQVASGVIDAISRPRLTTFGMEPSPDCDLIAVVARHGRNVAVCEAFYPLLHFLEIVVRNRIHDVFSAHFGTTEWYRLAWIHPKETALIDKAERELREHRKESTPDNIVAALTFGFWCSLFNTRYEPRDGNEPWPTLIRRVLPRAPRYARTRNGIQGRLEKARKIRNRVFHHEPISHIRDLPAQHAEMVELLGWFSPEVKEHLSHLCRFDQVWNDRLVSA